MTDALQELSTAIAIGLNGAEGDMKSRIEALFGDRYPKRHFVPTAARNAYGLATGDDEIGVPYAGLINPDNPPSGPYGGTSVVWFPTTAGSLIDFGVGTRGLAPDEGILTRPGHRRRITALRRYLSRRGIECWTKPDPSALGVSVPKSAIDRFPGFEKVFKRYGAELYACARTHIGQPYWSRTPIHFSMKRVTCARSRIHGFVRGARIRGLVDPRIRDPAPMAFGSEPHSCGDRRDTGGVRVHVDPGNNSGAARGG